MASMRKYGSFETPHFAEGRFRLAYKGQWIEHPSKAGQKFVLKELKDKYTWKPSDWDTTVKIYTKASELAKGFNEYSSTDHPIRFTDVDIKYVINQPDPNTRPKLAQCVIVEDYIEGKYEKWCNNYGYLSPESLSMPAFMHWSWVHTKGQLMVADLQGVRKSNSYFLTDPAILSVDNSYGPTDRGVEGMFMFFYNHKCNEFCKRLPKPEPSDFIGKIHPSMLEDCKRLLQSVNNSTTYQAEKKFNEQTKMKVKEILQQVASRQVQLPRPAHLPVPVQPAAILFQQRAQKRPHPSAAAEVMLKRLCGLCGATDF